ncbi:uncharacterized protein LOC141504445 [Macrotis lagotis]|uniref:uncharacterized protein LOC141504445 n=1 Tax=Macrotis lagotis TaxID=92651 RepID=UPI003D680C99
MSLKTFWRDYKVLLVMIPSIGLIHIGWKSIKNNPIFQTANVNEDSIPEPGNVTRMIPQKNQNQVK